MDDTIVALATPWGRSAIAKIRVSGSLCLDIIKIVFSRAKVAPRHAYLDNFVTSQGEIVDQVIFLFFDASHSYTGQDSLEIDCHGNPIIITKITDALCTMGCRIAHPGEFTRRAFLNRRLDLCQAEAVLDIIHAKSERALALAQRQLGGILGHRISELSSNLIKILASLEAQIDFPDEEVGFDQNVYQIAIKISQNLQRFIDTNFYKNHLENGIDMVIVGRPNVGKSSLMNALLNTDRAIVSPEPGTTRDFISETIKIGPDVIKIYDTAGIRFPESSLEKIGIDKTLELTSRGDLILLVLDATATDYALDEFRQLSTEKPYLVVLNKIDLLHGQTMKMPFAIEGIKISTKTGQGMADLRAAIAKIIAEKNLMPSEDEFIVNSRHVQILSKAKNYLDLAIEKLGQGNHIELAASDVRLSLEILGEITGKYDNESMLDELFGQFCIGK
ncbi:MAG: tRNA uridine-5-carboxymethylaminomethyl(34) synthesis GTPase MnmE [Puniceicoccales bacterium]|jgi:tRNA modification GTPase|nr:tRNA uridine-5-carboxymethylaminomethyl(34) synthesis GTPase MnmE [Puniceicoccales bacterium]